MAPSNKASSAARRKSSKGMLILKLSPKALKRLEPSGVGHEDSSSKVSSTAESTALHLSTGENVLGSNSHTPAQPDTPGCSSMPPPTESIKRKGNKRSAAGLDGNPTLKVRGRPGPKKKARLDDRKVDQSTATPRALNGTAVKLGPKANQGAINAGLRALDRSGKPCRKWAKGSFRLKSFTGISWEIPRWKTPLKIVAIHNTADSTTGDLCKKNKNADNVESIHSEKSNTLIDIEMTSLNSHSVSSPAPQLLSSGEALDQSIHSSPITNSA